MPSNERKGAEPKCYSFLGQGTDATRPIDPNFMTQITIGRKWPNGCQDFTQRMTKFPDAFEKVTGEKLQCGTLNIQVEQPIQIREHFRLKGTEIGEPHQDLLFEICRVNGIWAYRIRPYQEETGAGGHGDNIIEISSATWISENDAGLYEITFFR